MKTAKKVKSVLLSRLRTDLMNAVSFLFQFVSIAYVFTGRLECILLLINS